MELDLNIAADIAAVPRLVDQLEHYAHAAALPPLTAHRLSMICEELATNVATHGTLRGGKATAIAIRLRRRGTELHLLVEDDGPAFDPLSAETPDIEAALEDRDIGGLGLHLVRTLARGLRYERTEARNRLKLVLDAEDRPAIEEEL
jgi:serine/threonine-protein kinase RsbW